MTIESHYNALRDEVLRLESQELRLTGDRYGVLGTNRFDEVCQLATELAAQDWENARSKIAAGRGPMPEGPVRFGSTGYTVTLGVCSHRGCETFEEEYAKKAIDMTLWKVRDELDAARARFERYAQLVEQGVALAPSDGTESA